MASLEEEIHQKKFENELVKANLNILFTANWLTNRISGVLKPFGLSHEQFNALRILRGKHPEPMCQKDILQRMIARQSNLTLILKKLRQKGFVEIQQDADDKRAYMISITHSGLEHLLAVDQALATIKGQWSQLSVSEAFHLNALLDKIREV